MELEYASEELRKDKEIVEAALKKSVHALKFVNPEILKDEEVLKKVIKKSKKAIMYLPKQILLELVKQKGEYLKYASQELKNDKEILLKSIEINIETLVYMNYESLLKDEEIIEKIKKALENSKDTIPLPTKIWLELVKADGQLLKYADNKNKNNKEIVYEAIKQDGRFIEYASDRQKNNKKTMSEAIKNSGTSLKYASEELKNDKELVMEAVKNNPDILLELNEKLYQDKEIKKPIIIENIKDKTTNTNQRKKMENMSKFYLEEPTLKRKEQAIEYLKEYIEHKSNIHGSGSLEKYRENYENWLEYLKQKSNQETCPPGYVPSTTYFLIKEDEDKIIGMIDIRHTLNEYLLQYGGHIGYGIRPTEREKGYNKINLYLGILKSKELGLDKVLITATDINPGSYKTILALGGTLENKTPDDEEPEVLLGRYWIDVDKSIKEYKNTYKDNINIDSNNNKKL